MRRVLILCLIALVAVTSAQTATAKSKTSKVTKLVVTADFAEGLGPETWTLQCAPIKGNHPNATAACALLKAKGVTLFAPVPKSAACTMIYGGDQKAIVKGLIAGKKVSTTFTRTNGCEISRYERALALYTVPNTQVVKGTVSLDGVATSADVIFTNGTQYFSATANETGFVVRLNFGTWSASAGVGRSCTPLTVTVPGPETPVNITCSSKA